MKKSTVSLVICLSLFALVSHVFGQSYSGGSGTSDDPYQISATADLLYLSNNSSDWSKHFVQTSNITFNADQSTIDWNGDGTISDPNGFRPIGNSSTKFTGSYDGKGFQIENIYIDLNLSSYGGLFGYTRDALITGVNVRNIEIVDGFTTGAVIGRAEVTTLSYSSSSGSINSSSTTYMGGLVGRGDTATISHVYSQVNISTSFGSRVGGIVGQLYGKSTLNHAYSRGDLSANSMVGGVVSDLRGNSYGTVRSTINYSYSTGQISAVSTSPFISGGVVAYISGPSSSYDSFWDEETTQMDTSRTGTGKSTSSMKDIQTYTEADSLGLDQAWDFVGTLNDDVGSDDYWKIDNSVNDGYPYMTWQDSLAFSTTPSVGSITTTSSTLNLELEDEGIVYLVVLYNGSAIPTSDQVKRGKDASDSTPVFADTINTSSNLGSSSITGLSSGTTYDVHLVTNDDGPKPLSGITTITFTTSSTPATPDQVTLSSPADGADSVDASPTLQWASSSNATGYDVQVSTDGFATTVVNSSTSGTSLSPSLDWSMSYSWRVRATNQSGSADWSEVWDFTTRAVPVPDPPSLSFPVQGATGLAADSVLEWGASAYATEYDLEVSTTATFATTVVNSSTTGRSLSPSLGWSSTYYWRVRATNGSGESDWSEARSFSTRAIPLPGSPTVTGGSGGSGGDGSGNPDPSSRTTIPTQVPVDTTLTWTPGEYATQYRIQVSADTFATFAHNSTVASASFTVNLDYLTMYQWRVRSVNNSGQSPWSDTLAFITQVPPVEQIPASAMTPDNNTMHAPLNPTLQWQAMPHADAYHLEVTADSFATTMMNATTADTTHPIEGLAYEHRYHWRVRATNATGDGPWSESVGFRTQLPPVQATTMRAPQQNGTDVEIPTTFEWEPVEKATTYEFMLFTDDMLTEVLATHTTDTSITIDTLGYDREYLARVRPKNVTSAGPWRSVEFTTVANGLTTSNEGSGSGVGGGTGTGADGIPTTYGLEQNYPNPFNPTTVIRYALPTASDIQLEVYDMMGRKVSTLVRGAKSAGYHEVVFDASHLGSGAYMYRLVAGDVVLARTLYLIK